MNSLALVFNDGSVLPVCIIHLNALGGQPNVDHVDIIDGGHECMACALGGLPVRLPTLYERFDDAWTPVFLADGVTEDNFDDYVGLGAALQCLYEELAPYGYGTQTRAATREKLNRVIDYLPHGIDMDTWLEALAIADTIVDLMPAEFETR